MHQQLAKHQTIQEQIGAFTTKELEIAEFCLTYDCTSVKKPNDTSIGLAGYTKTRQGSPIPRCMCQQGGIGDGASGQDGLIVVGYTDMNGNGVFDTGDEIYGCDGYMGDRIQAGDWIDN